MAKSSPSKLNFTRRVDLHCHSRASTEADEAVLQAIRCPESYSEPREIHALAKKRGMDFVTITDHDSIAGVGEILNLPGVFVGEELTCYFPEDHCKIHLLVWGIDQKHHQALQDRAEDIQAVAEYVAKNDFAHSVAHPLYRQNGKLDRTHIERLLLLFRGFECLNGAHSMGHREAFEPLLDDLDAAEIRRMERVYKIEPLYSNPWKKVRTAGSDDHGMFNIGRTWTEFPEDAKTVDDILKCLRDGRCQPGGEAGSSAKLAHNFYGVGIRYHTRSIAKSPGSVESILMRRLVGEKSDASKLSLAWNAMGFLASGAKKKISRTLGLRPAARGTELLGELVGKSAMQRVRQSDAVWGALKDGRAAFAEHQPLFDLVSDINRDVCGGIFSSVGDSLKDGQIGAIFDAVSTVLAHQATLLPYYFALFHQNQERHLLSEMTGRGRRAGDRIRVAVFTDSSNARQPAGDFVNGLAQFAELRDVELIVHTCSDELAKESNRWKNFRPLATQRVDAVKMDLVLPPVLEVLEWADRKQFDVVLANTRGPMGACAWLVAKMLRTPLLAMCHEDVAKRVMGFTGGDYRVTMATSALAEWFNNSAHTLLLRSRRGMEISGITAEKCVTIAPIPRTITPAADPTDSFWREKNVAQPLRLLCPASLSSRKDVVLIATAFKQVCGQRQDVALILLGDGPLLGAMKELTAGVPVYCFGNEIDALEFCAKGDLLLYADRDDVTAQLVIDAQAAGLPVLVSESGAAREFVDEEVTGHILPSDDANLWAEKILLLLANEKERQRMSRSARQRSQRRIPSKAYEQVWDACRRAISDDPSVAQPLARPEPQKPDVKTISEATLA
ncbi:MAG: glycosyltransferase [Tepidisphaeraceae bacterium]|jgi:glycosyltransferase involved in cell wall biosynthesis